MYPGTKVSATAAKRKRKVQLQLQMQVQVHPQAGTHSHTPHTQRLGALSGRDAKAASIFFFRFSTSPRPAPRSTT